MIAAENNLWTLHALLLELVVKEKIRAKAHQGCSL
jgi:hypothetical protein